MKIVVYGYSGSGKSTLTKIISKEYELPVLHVDKILYNPNWERKSKDESKQLMAQFLKTNKNWIIDGNGVSMLFDERMQMADKIIFMNFSPWKCYKQARKRYKEYKNKERESRPDGCHEKFNRSFAWWILFDGRKKDRVIKLNEPLKKYPEKIVVLNNEKEVNNFVSKLDTFLLK